MSIADDTILAQKLHSLESYRICRCDECNEYRLFIRRERQRLRGERLARLEDEAVRWQESNPVMAYKLLQAVSKLTGKDVHTALRYANILHAKNKRENSQNNVVFSN